MEIARRARGPGTDLLADVAARHHGAQEGREALRQISLVLDRQVGDATTGIEHAWFGEGPCRAGVEAGGAPPTVLRGGRARFELEVRQPNENTSLVVDGRVICRLEPGDHVRTVRATPIFKLVEVPGHGYYRTLREKLGWGGELPLNRNAGTR